MSPVRLSEIPESEKSMFHILTYDHIPMEALDWLPQQGVALGPDIAAPDAILLRSHNLRAAPIPESVLAVGRAGAGVNNIPVDELSKRGVPVFNAPGANANAVKELTLAGLLLASRNIVAAAEFVHGLEGDEATIHKLVERGKKKFVGTELRGKRIGVVGLGAIGVQVANAAHDLGMYVYGYDPMLTVERAIHLSPAVVHFPHLDDILPQVDFLTVHVPLAPDTKRLIDEKRVAALGEGAVLVNFSRAEIVDQTAVCAALEGKRLRAYVTDFAAPALINQPRAIVLPHLGASTLEAENNSVTSVTRTLLDFLETGEIRNSVNFPSVALPRGPGPRLVVANENVPGVVSNISAALAAAQANIENLLNKSKGNFAFTLVDVSGGLSEETLSGIRSIAGVLSARLIPARAQ
jgi:D-3-phosphoglycerate dehydrogenase / 2-oxoglutarate reductase